MTNKPHLHGPTLEDGPQIVTVSGIAIGIPRSALVRYGKQGGVAYVLEAGRVHVLLADRGRVREANVNAAVREHIRAEILAEVAGRT